MTILVLAAAASTGWITCSVVMALLIARGIRLAEREAHRMQSTRFGGTLPSG